MSASVDCESAARAEINFPDGVLARLLLISVSILHPPMDLPIRDGPARTSVPIRKVRIVRSGGSRLTQHRGEQCMPSSSEIAARKLPYVRPGGV